MSDFTHQNHYRYTWNGVEFSSPDHANTTFGVSFGALTQPPKSFREECVRAARLIREGTTKNLRVALSGGCDSEIVCRAFKEANISIRATTFRFHDDLNQQDVYYAKKYCDDNDIPLDLIDLDLRKFWEAEIFEYTDLVAMRSPHRAMLLKMIDTYDDYLIFGGGDLKIHRAENTHSVYVRESAESTLFFEYLKLRNKEGSPRFFIYTPELIVSFLEEPLVKSFVRCAHSMKMLSIKHFKPLLFSHLWPEMPTRRKCHGFELVVEQDQTLREILDKRYADRRPKAEVNIPVEVLRDLLIAGDAFHGQQT